MDAYGADVWNYAFFLTRKADLADDIAQEVFVRVYERLYSFRGEAAMKTWLLTIARNLVRDHWRSAWFRRVVPFAAPQRKEQTLSAESEAFSRFASDDIWRAVLSLSVKYRETLLLHAHYDMSYAEIAALLKVSEGTVKSRLSRARAKVSELLGGEEDIK